MLNNQDKLMHTKNDESIKVSPSLAIKNFHQFLEKKINKKKTLRPKTRKNQFSLLGSQKSITSLISHKLKNLNTAIFLHKDCRPMSVGWDPQERQRDRQQKQLGSGAVGHLTYTFCPVIISVEIKRHYLLRWDPFHIGKARELPSTYHCFFFIYLLRGKNSLAIAMVKTRVLLHQPVLSAALHT